MHSYAFIKRPQSSSNSFSISDIKPFTVIISAIFYVDTYMI